MEATVTSLWLQLHVEPDYLTIIITIDYYSLRSILMTAINAS